MASPKIPPLLLSGTLVVVSVISAAWAFAQSLLWPDVTFPTLEELARDGLLRVGYTNERPFSYLDPDARATGESFEVLRHVLGRMGIRTFAPMRTDWDSLIPDLEAGRIDIIAAGMYPTPERSQRVLFSLTTFCTRGGFVVRRNTDAPRSLEALSRHAGVRVAVVRGTLEEGRLGKMGVEASRILAVPDIDTAVSFVESKRADVFWLTDISARLVASRRPHLEAVALAEDVDGCAAFAVRKQDHAFLRVMNLELERYIGTPAHLESTRPFGFSKENIPPWAQGGTP